MQRHSRTLTPASPVHYYSALYKGYERTDIAEWARTIAEHASDCDDVFVYFKHEKAGRGAEFARMLGQDLSAI